MAAPQLYGKTPSARMIYWPDTRRTTVVDRVSAVSIADAPGHPLSLTTYRALAGQVQAARPELSCEFRALKPLPRRMTQARVKPPVKAEGAAT